MPCSPNRIKKEMVKNNDLGMESSRTLVSKPRRKVIKIAANKIKYCDESRMDFQSSNGYSQFHEENLLKK